MQDGGLNRYAYVAGNPETATDPTGHLFTCGGEGDCGGVCTSKCSPPPPTPPTGGGCKTNCGGSPAQGGGGGSGGFGPGKPPSCETNEHVCPGQGAYDEYNLFNLMGEKWAHGPITAFGLTGLQNLYNMLQDLQSNKLGQEEGFELTAYSVIAGGIGGILGALGGPIGAGVGAVIAGGVTLGVLKGQFDLASQRLGSVMDQLQHLINNISAWDKQGVHKYDSITFTVTALDTDTPQIPGMPGALYWGEMQTSTNISVPDAPGNPAS